MMEGHIVETRLYVGLISIERLMENVLHDLGKTNKNGKVSSMIKGH